MKRPLSIVALVALLFLQTLSQVACTGPLLSRKQLKGADPASDLAASNVLPRLLSLGASRLSIRGVKLGDPESRVLALWGKPSMATLQSSIWKNRRGQIIAVLLWKTESRSRSKMLGGLRNAMIGSKKPRNVRVLSQLDLFPGALPWLHPRNRLLLKPQTVLSQLWRKAALGAMGRERRGPFRLSYCYASGICLSQFNNLAPQKQRQKIIFSLYPSS